ncbi:MAG: polymer-forming cytoskeletal protein, partial [Burkholderiales bacterium]
MLQKDSLFRRNESFFRSPTPPLPPATPAAAAETPKPAEAPKPVVDKHDERKESKLIVGPDIKMKGVEIADCDTLVVEGRIEATLDSRVLQITQTGVFCGTVAVDTAEIHGKLEGDLTVRKQLVIHATGKVSGKIRYAKIKVEE